MQVPPVDRRISELVTELAQYRGHRTIWLDLRGTLVHTEPEEELEDRGYLYVTTVLRPDRDTLFDAVARFVSTAPAHRGLAMTTGPDLAAANLAPA